MFSFFLPHFPGAPKARGRCSQGERVLYGRDLCRSGGTGKAETAQCVVCIPDTGPRAQEFGPSSAQENAWQKKVGLPNKEDRCCRSHGLSAAKAEQRKSAPVAQSLQVRQSVRDSRGSCVLRRLLQGGRRRGSKRETKHIAVSRRSKRLRMKRPRFRLHLV